YYVPVPSLFLLHPAPTEIYTLSLHDALPISGRPGTLHSGGPASDDAVAGGDCGGTQRRQKQPGQRPGRLSAKRGVAGARYDARRDRKSTRLNSSHSQISYAVFCLKKKK